MAQEALILSSFAYILEASFGLNIAFGLIEQIHDGGARSYNGEKSKFFADFRRQVDGVFSEGTQAADIEYKKTTDEWDEREKGIIAESKKKVGRAVPWAYIATAISLVLLASIGFIPTLEVPLWSALVVIIALVVPTPIMYFHIKRFWADALDQLKKEFAFKTRVMEQTEKMKKSLAARQGERSEGT